MSTQCTFIIESTYRGKHYAVQCANLTRDPSGRCHYHGSKTPTVACPTCHGTGRMPATAPAPAAGGGGERVMHDYGCPIGSRVHRIDQLAYRLCRARDLREAKAIRVDLRKAMTQLEERVNTRCEQLEAAGQGAGAAAEGG